MIINELIRVVNVGGKASFEAPPMSRFLVRTPGGGGFGKIEDRKPQTGENRDADEVVGGSLNSFKKMQEQC